MTLNEYAQRLKDTPRFRALMRKHAITVSLQAERQSKLLATRRLNVRSGRLRGSIRGFVRTVSGKLEIGVQAGGDRRIPYARIQELGGQVRARNARYLAIPLSAAKTKAGVSRFASPRDVDGLFSLNLGGRLFLVKKDRDALVFMYVLKRSVTIRGKHYLRDGLLTAIRTHLDPAMARAVHDVIEGPGGSFSGK